MLSDNLGLLAVNRGVVIALITLCFLLFIGLIMGAVQNFYATRRVEAKLDSLLDRVNRPRQPPQE